MLKYFVYKVITGFTSGSKLHNSEGYKKHPKQIEIIYLNGGAGFDTFEEAVTAIVDKLSFSKFSLNTYTVLPVITLKNNLKK